MRGGVLMRVLGWSIALALVALPIVGVLSGRFASDRWPIRTLKLKAEFVNVSAEQVRAAVAAQSGRGFFALDLESIRSDVAGLPWVARVEASKRWPDTLELTVHERVPFARWGDARLVSQAGELFSVPGVDGARGLPQLSGPDDRVADVLEFHARCQRDFKDTGLVASEVRLSDRGGWQLVLASGVIVDVGSEQVEARLRRFIDVWPRIDRSRGEPVSIDLRYENGFAVRWSTAASTSDPVAKVPAPTIDRV